MKKKNTLLKSASTTNVSSRLAQQMRQSSRQSTKQQKLDFIKNSPKLTSNFKRLQEEAMKKAQEELQQNPNTEQTIDNVCWNWQNSKSRGYGAFHFRFGKTHSSLLAHQIALYLSTGEDQTFNIVCHRCNNPSCVNPSHIYLGTNQTNGTDLRNKNLQATLPKYFKKFSKDDIIKIRNEYSQGKITQRDLAKKYQTSQPTISDIVRGERYVAVSGPLILKCKSSIKSDKYCKLKKEDRKEIIHLFYFKNTTITQLAKKYNVANQAIRDIIRKPERLLLQSPEEREAEELELLQLEANQLENSQPENKEEEENPS